MIRTGDALISSRESALSAAHGYVESFVTEHQSIANARGRGEEIGTSEPSPAVGALLSWLADLIDAKNVVDIGTGAGVSALWLSQGMNPEGVLTSIDAEAEHIRLARESISDAGLAPSRIRLIVGDCLDVLSRLADGAYDLVVWRGEPRDVASGVLEAQRLLRVGGVLVIDQALWHLRVPDPAQRDERTIALREVAKLIRSDESWRTSLLPIDQGLLLATKVALPGE
jgi:predicted O-methyltransferase YrrM